MVVLLKIAIQPLADVVGFAVLPFRPTQSVQAENLFLRRQLALYRERGVQPRRIDAATRISLDLLARFFEWWDA
jgi:putative transposase